MFFAFDLHNEGSGVLVEFGSRITRHILRQRQQFERAILPNHLLRSSVISNVMQGGRVVGASGQDSAAQITSHSHETITRQLLGGTHGRSLHMQHVDAEGALSEVVARRKHQEVRELTVQNLVAHFLLAIAEPDARVGRELKLYRSHPVSLVAVTLHAKLEAFKFREAPQVERVNCLRG